MAMSKVLKSLKRALAPTVHIVFILSGSLLYNVTSVSHSLATLVIQSAKDNKTVITLSPYLAEMWSHEIRRQNVYTSYVAHLATYNNIAQLPSIERK